MLRLRRVGQITGKQVPEIILLNSHDGTSSYPRRAWYRRRCEAQPGSLGDGRSDVEWVSVLSLLSVC
jgi:hypothetical protein